MPKTDLYHQAIFHHVNFEMLKKSLSLGKDSFISAEGLEATAQDPVFL